MSHSPLLSASDIDAIFAWLPDGPRRVRDFLAEAEALAAQLPPGRHLLNVCQDRYRFAVGFAAGLTSGRVSLQPAAQSADTLHRLQAEFPDIVCLHDGHFDSHGLPSMVFPDSTAAPGKKIEKIPQIADDTLAAILFTSGSTGRPQAHRKTWGKLVRSGRAEAERFGLNTRAQHIVGTVPVQHSYGFESTFLLPLHGNCPFWAGKPFYPQDIVAALSAVPQPRLLVTTPFHLSALLASGLELPPVDMLLSATAPLSAALAAQAEERTGAPTMEIYGSTETGQLASRRTTDGATWTLLPGPRLEQEGDAAYALEGHVEGRVPLSDLIEILDSRRFVLHGRHADLINIAGKRTSLAYLNHQLGEISGVVDGAFFLPDDTIPDGITRLTAFVVAPTLDSRALMRALRERVDAIFLPRPLVFVDQLPRNTTGKLPRNNLQALYAEKVKHG